MEKIKDDIYKDIDPSEMPLCIKAYIELFDLSFYRIETFISPKFLRVQVYKLSEEEWRTQDD